MKTSRFTEEQRVAILREADKMLTPEAARKHKVSEQTIYDIRKRIGVLEATDFKRMRQLNQQRIKL
jgi:putative transposase